MGGWRSGTGRTLNEGGNGDNLQGKRLTRCARFGIPHPDRGCWRRWRRDEVNVGEGHLDAPG